MSSVELFCGIGGMAEAAKQLRSESEACSLITRRAIDIDRDCGRVYQHNFGLTVDCQSIESLDWNKLATPTDQESFWWLSPPCQPYCRRGRRSWETDQRCSAMLALIKWLESRPARLPQKVALENVPGFADSSHCRRLCEALHDNGFSVVEARLCPTQFGIPNRRLRYYLLASRCAAMGAIRIDDGGPASTLADVLDPIPPSVSDLWLSTKTATDYRRAIDIVDADDPLAVTACFGSGYGKSIIRSGSYLRQNGRLRRFSPAEVSRLLGFSESFSFPAEFSNRKRWKMLGNSLSIPIVKSILKAMHGRNHKA